MPVRRKRVVTAAGYSRRCDVGRVRIRASASGATDCVEATHAALPPCGPAEKRANIRAGPNENHRPVWEECMFFARALAALVFATSVLASGAASAQSYPARPITMICPFPPGGATDTIARVIQDSMARTLGQPIVIENIGGAGGMIAAARAARAEPDGYTIMIHQVALA